MKFKLLTSAVLLFAAQTAMALPQSQPLVCPAAAEIQKVGVTSVVREDGPVEEWMGVELNKKFGTNDDWTFAIGGYTGTREEILAKANHAITTLVLTGGPYRFNGQQEMWYCTYQSSDSSARYAVALTPPLDVDVSKAARLK